MRRRDKRGQRDTIISLPYLFPLTEISFSRGQIPFDTVCPISSTISGDGCQFDGCVDCPPWWMSSCNAFGSQGQSVWAAPSWTASYFFYPRWEDCSHVLLNAARRPLSSLTILILPKRKPMTLVFDQSGVLVWPLASFPTDFPGLQWFTLKEESFISSCAASICPIGRVAAELSLSSLAFG